MNDKQKKKLKKKIWVISLVVLVTYVVALILNPTALTALLPIIISASILMVGLPAYAIIKSIKENFQTETEINNVTEMDNIEPVLEKEKTYDDSNIKENDIIIQETYEPSYQKDRVKVKTKGTIS